MLRRLEQREQRCGKDGGFACELPMLTRELVALADEADAVDGGRPQARKNPPPRPAARTAPASDATPATTEDDGTPTINVVCGTFNVGNHPIEDLGSWISKLARVSPSRRP